jgi:hypothetical protein
LLGITILLTSLYVSFTSRYKLIEGWGFFKKVFKKVKKAAKVTVKSVGKAAKVTVKSVGKAAKVTVKSVGKAAKVTVMGVGKAAKKTVMGVGKGGKFFGKLVLKTGTLLGGGILKTGKFLGGGILKAGKLIGGGIVGAIKKIIDLFPISKRRKIRREIHSYRDKIRVLIRKINKTYLKQIINDDVKEDIRIFILKTKHTILMDANTIYAFKDKSISIKRANVSKNNKILGYLKHIYKYLAILNTDDYINVIISNRNRIKSMCNGVLDLSCMSRLDNKNIIKYRNAEMSNIHTMGRNIISKQDNLERKKTNLTNTLSKLDNYDISNLKSSNAKLSTIYDDKQSINDYLKNEIIQRNT